ncbi:MAG TPA: CDP-glycerol glycerophosphotransferase family protein [Rhabdochlamydiaceae bacterium]|nr:CDP-glycerol glycerophosphotransferase family protein [Rhabdochlamydiaceae bacterium]
MPSTIKNYAGLIYGPEPHHLDHLAPLCTLLQIPLIVTEEEISNTAHKYYPWLDVILWDYLEISQNLPESYDVIFCSIPRDIFDEIFFFSQKILHKKVHTVWCPHGNSDKGTQTYFMEALQKEVILLVYGQKMIDFLMKKEAFKQMKSYVVIGNYRSLSYKRELEFYKRMVSKEILGKMKKPSKIVLYAPTWQDYEQSSSFYDACPHLIENLPEDWNLIIKPHPNLLSQDAGKVDQIMWKYEECPNVLFLTEFPLIYPLLEVTDIYIGDMSSIGYDFLTFDRPMFFLNQNKRDSKTDEGLYLYKCGVEILPKQYPEIYKIIDVHLPTDALTFSTIRKQIYDYTFGEEKNWDDLRQSIYKACDVLPNSDLDFM